MNLTFWISKAKTFLMVYQSFSPNLPEMATMRGRLIKTATMLTGYCCRLVYRIGYR